MQQQNQQPSREGTPAELTDSSQTAPSATAAVQDTTNQHATPSREPEDQPTALPPNNNNNQVLLNTKDQLPYTHNSSSLQPLLLLALPPPPQHDLLMMRTQSAQPLQQLYLSNSMHLHWIPLFIQSS
jgi:hypothetical protein